MYYFTKYGKVSLYVVEQITSSSDINYLDKLNYSNSQAIRHLARARKNIIVRLEKETDKRRTTWLREFIEQRLSRVYVQ